MRTCASCSPRSAAALLRRWLPCPRTRRSSTGIVARAKTCGRACASRHARGAWHTMTAPRMQRLVMGAERAPVLVVDDFVAEPEQLVRRVAGSPFVPQGAMFPGVRTRAPLSYRQMLLDFLRPLLPEFGLRPGTLDLKMAHYSLVSLPPGQLVFLQRIPHIDSVASNGLATVHYLFRGNW